jgi:hypothetical protein
MVKDLVPILNTPSDWEAWVRGFFIAVEAVDEKCWGILTGACVAPDEPLDILESYVENEEREESLDMFKSRLENEERREEWKAEVSHFEIRKRQMRAWIYATTGPVARQLIFNIDDLCLQFAKLESTYNLKTPQAVDPEASTIPSHQRLPLLISMNGRR